MGLGCPRTQIKLQAPLEPASAFYYLKTFELLRRDGALVRLFLNPSTGPPPLLCLRLLGVTPVAEAKCRSFNMYARVLGICCIKTCEGRIREDANYYLYRLLHRQIALQVEAVVAAAVVMAAAARGGAAATVTTSVKAILVVELTVYFNVLYYTILYDITLYYTILYYILYYTILYCIKIYYTRLYYIKLDYTIYILLYYTILYYMILYCTKLYYSLLYDTIRYYTILYYMILYYIILYYTI